MVAGETFASRRCEPDAGGNGVDVTLTQLELAQLWRSIPWPEEALKSRDELKKQPANYLAA
ncbi:hypothetical protein B5P45_26545 [Phyllobacterium zundukense]|uniref:Uncharacterized protein n=1 Tax=Phyllobacterium zundukense TaxID=1867719 RepID=A0A2N9VQQ9_9HYPH|nr:hypothetical protein BLM14_07365 [Phyllobacterium zundukense]PIO41827.1 hypothetical protein B5P45_26545 [Phyllobacterium zundukense]